MPFDKQYILHTLKDILAVDSPTGYTDKALAKVNALSKTLGYPFSMTKKGTGVITVAGNSDRTVGVTAHIDTLGLMVRTINDDATIAFTSLGAPSLPTYDGEYCKIYTRDGAVYTGTILSNYPSVHVYKEAAADTRSEGSMHVRLDEKVKKKSDVAGFGISSGDFICIDPKTEILKNNFIKSRFLDNKLSVAAVFGVLKYIKDSKILPKFTVKFMFSGYEEVGHGMSYVPPEISEMIALDMGCVGADLNCTEFDVSICAKDSGGPYDYTLTTQLIKLAKENKLKYAVDVYPSYNSDGGAALRGGNDIRAALIGPGVSASHGMERSHYDAVENTMALLCLYMGFSHIR